MALSLEQSPAAVPPRAAESHMVSTGQPLASAGWLDAHYESCRPEYEALLRSVGIQPGWHVLDAGCGGGSYLPLLAELVGPGGRIAALDLAPENVAAVRARAAAGGVACPVDARTGSLTPPLPYCNGAFDAVWCANVLQYLTDEELRATLAEFRRVVRPGGLVAVKDDEDALWLVSPCDPAVYWRLFDALTRTDGAIGVQTRGAFRGRALRRRLEDAGLAQVWQRTSLIERWAPLRLVERAYMGGYLAFLAGEAAKLDLPTADHAYWWRQQQLGAPEALVNHPEFYWCEANLVAVGRVPGTDSSLWPTCSRRELIAPSEESSERAIHYRWWSPPAGLRRTGSSRTSRGSAVRCCCSKEWKSVPGITAAARRWAT